MFLLGRQYAFNLTVLISSVFGLCLAAPSTYNGVLVLTAFVGFGVGGNIPIDTTICLEFLPQVYLNHITPTRNHLTSGRIAAFFWLCSQSFSLLALSFHRESHMASFHSYVFLGYFFPDRYPVGVARYPYGANGAFSP